MSQIQQLEMAVKALPKSDFEAFKRWLVEFDGEPALKAIGPKNARKPGTLQGTVLYMAPDFDAPLDDFKDYM